MKLDEQALEAAKQAFTSHRYECRLCSMYVFGYPETFKCLCSIGISRLNAVLKLTTESQLIETENAPESKQI